MRTTTNYKTVAACVAVLCAVLSATGCSFDPLKFAGRNACEFFNCDELFFIEEMLPLSARPAAAAGGGAVMDMAEPEEEGGGHAH